MNIGQKRNRTISNRPPRLLSLDCQLRFTKIKAGKYNSERDQLARYQANRASQIPQENMNRSSKKASRYPNTTTYCECKYCRYTPARNATIIVIFLKRLHMNIYTAKLSQLVILWHIEPPCENKIMETKKLYYRGVYLDLQLLRYFYSDNIY